MTLVSKLVGLPHGQLGARISAEAKSGSYFHSVQKDVVFSSSYQGSREPGQFILVPANGSADWFSYLCTYDLYSPVHNVLDACISNPLPLALIMDMHASKTLFTGLYKSLVHRW